MSVMTSTKGRRARSLSRYKTSSSSLLLVVVVVVMVSASASVSIQMIGRIKDAKSRAPRFDFPSCIIMHRFWFMGCVFVFFSHFFSLLCFAILSLERR